MHGRAQSAKRPGIAPQHQPTKKFAQLFRNDLVDKTRANGFQPGLRPASMNAPGRRRENRSGEMVKTKRINPMEIIGGHAVEDLSGCHMTISTARNW